MRWFRVFLAFIGLVLGAVSARAEPVLEPAGEPTEGDSWYQAWYVRTSGAGLDFPPSEVYGCDWIQAHITPIGPTVTNDKWDSPEGLLQFKHRESNTEPWTDEPSWEEVYHSDSWVAATGDAIVATSTWPRFQFTTGFAGKKKDKDDLRFDIYFFQGDTLLHSESWVWSSGAWAVATGPTPEAGKILEPFSVAFLGSAFVGVVGLRLRKRRKEGDK